MFSLLIDESDSFNFTDLTDLVSIIIYDIIFCGVQNSRLKVFCFAYYTSELKLNDIQYTVNVVTFCISKLKSSKILIH